MPLSASILVFRAAKDGRFTFRKERNWFRAYASHACDSHEHFGRIAQLVQSVPTFSREGHWFEDAAGSQSMHFVYILQSERDSSFYIGETRNVKERLTRHNEGRERYTKIRCPWKLVHTESFGSRLEAIRREREIKRRKSRKYILSLIESGA